MHCGYHHPTVDTLLSGYFDARLSASSICRLEPMHQSVAMDVRYSGNKAYRTIRVALSSLNESSCRKCNPSQAGLKMFECSKRPEAGHHKDPFVLVNLLHYQ